MQINASARGRRWGSRARRVPPLPSPSHGHSLAHALPLVAGWRRKGRSSYTASTSAFTGANSELMLMAMPFATSSGACYKGVVPGMHSEQQCAWR